MLRVAHSAWVAWVLAVSSGCGGDDAGSGGDEGSSTADFCDALGVLEAKCQRCHQDPPKNLAPFPLLTYADTQEERPTGELVYERMRDVVSSGIMPPTSGNYDPPVDPLTCAERTTLLSWLNADAPRPRGNDPSCAGVEPRLIECTD
jgi:uncharacterized membrane protein